MATATSKMSEVRTSREFALLAGLCRSLFAGPDGASSAVSQPLDWPLFLRLARFHRVQGVALRGLRSQKKRPKQFIPNAIKQQLADDAAHIATVNLRMARESQALAERFAASEIAVLFIKGLTLEVLAYGDVATKSSSTSIY